MKHFLILLALLILQLAVIPALPDPLNELKIIFIVIVFCSLAYSFPFAIFYVFALTPILDLYSALPFGVITAIFLFVIFLLKEIFEKLFTNKSYYSMIVISGIGLALLKIFALASKSLLYFFTNKDMAQIGRMLAIELDGLALYFVLNLLFVTALFIIFHATSKRFKAVFVDTVRK